MSEMMEALQARPDAASDATGESLAAVRPSEWRDLALAHGAPEGESPLAYAERLQVAVERRFPTAALRARLERSDVHIRNFPESEVKRGVPWTRNIERLSVENVPSPTF